MKKTLILLSILTSFIASAQSIEINPNGGTNASAVLDLKSTTKGFLLPRMTNAQMRDIPSPAQGLLVFCTNCGTTANGEYYFYKGTAWVILSSTTVTSFTSIGAVSDIASSQGATVTSDGVLNLAPANATNPGIVTKTDQTFGGVKTFSSAPVLSSTTASKALFTDANKNIVSNEITGTGNVVMSNAPAFTGTITAATQTLSGTLGVGTSSPNTSAKVEVDATNKGVLLPRVTLTGSTDATTIATPATSLLVYNTATVSDVVPGYYYNSGTSGSPVWIRLNAGTLPVANGGTGATTLAANNVLLGNGTSTLQAVAPGANGNVLTSNGTTWTSAAASVPVPIGSTI